MQLIQTELNYQDLNSLRIDTQDFAATMKSHNSFVRLFLTKLNTSYISQLYISVIYDRIHNYSNY